MLWRKWWVVLLAVAAAACGWWALAAWREGVALAHARNLVASERFDRARPLLADLARRHPDSGELLYDLGVCDAALGRPDDAQAAWARVPDDSPFAGRAALLSARIALAGHRYAEAEPLLSRALREPGAVGLEARQSLALIGKFQGRLRETATLLRGGFDQSPEPVATLRELWELERSAYPAAEAAHALALAERAAPGDDRVALGLANLALQTG